MPSTASILGFRSATLGSPTSVAIAAPLAEGSLDPDAHTAPTRTGLFWSRTVGQQRTGLMVEGSEVFSAGLTGAQILGNTAWHAGNLNPALYQLVSQKGNPNGYASLDGTGKVPLAQLPPLAGLDYQGLWNASTNTPTLASGSPGYVAGDYFVVSVAGTTNLDGITDWQPGDWVISNGSAWQKIDNTDSFQVKASNLDPTPGFLSSKVDNVTIQVNGSFQLAVIQAGLTLAATQISVAAAGFTGVLSPSDTNVQLALNTLDLHSHSWTNLIGMAQTVGTAAPSGVPTTIDTALATTSQHVYRWLVRVKDGAQTQSFDILSGVTGLNSIDYTILPSNQNFTHTLNVTKAGATVTLTITPSANVVCDVIRWSWA